MPDLVTRPADPSQTVPPWAIVSAGPPPVLATGGRLVAGALQPASYSPVRGMRCGPHEPA